MKFTKMQGCGNDYVYVNGLVEKIPEEKKPELVRRLSDRHFGIGGDGVIFILPSKEADFEMQMFNADGTRAQMCGNGIRCVGKFVYDKGLTDKTTLDIETKAGIKTLVLTVENGRVSRVRVDMGLISCCAADIPVVGMGDRVIGRPVNVAGRNWIMTCVSVGNPHAVVWVDDVDAIPLEEIGPQFERHPMFPDRVNTEFVHVRSENELDMRVWERGSGETLACGTGATASAVAAHLCGLTGKSVTVHLRGGDLNIELGADGHAYMTGPATTVFEGEMEL